MPTVVANVLRVSGVQHHTAAKSVLPLPVTSFEVYDHLKCAYGTKMASDATGEIDQLSVSGTYLVGSNNTETQLGMVCSQG